MTDAMGSSGGVRFYKHSGRVPVAAGVVALMNVVVVGLVGGLVYGVLGFLCQLVPAAKISLVLEILLVVGFSLLLGGLPTQLFKRMNGRSTAMAVGMTVIGSAIGLYAAWVGWLYAFVMYVGGNQLTLLDVARPEQIFLLMRLLDEHGFWAIVGDSRPSGVVLAAIWVGEAGILMIAPAVFAKRQMQKSVYCDACEKWGTRRDLMQVAAGNMDAVKAGVTSGDLGVLSGIPRRADADRQWCDVYLEGCSSCGELQTLTVARTVQSVDKQGKSTFKTTPVVRRLVLTPEQVVQVAGIAGEV